MEAIFKLPYNQNGPVGNFYRKIKWDNGFEIWNLIRINTPGDGSCLFHAIENGFSIPYYQEMINGEKMDRNNIVRHMRKSLATKLASKVSSDPNSKTYYELINSGNTAEFQVSDNLPEYNYSLENMQKQLASNNNIGYGYIEFISNVLNKNIYILSSTGKDIYPFGKSELANIYKKDRLSIVLYYIENEKSNNLDHYELIGVMNDGVVDTHFEPDHYFIKFLYDKVQNKINL